MEKDINEEKLERVIQHEKFKLALKPQSKEEKPSAMDSRVFFQYLFFYCYYHRKIIFYFKYFNFTKEYYFELFN